MMKGKEEREEVGQESVLGKEETERAVELDKEESV